jgi:hypothetical protein
MVFNSFTLCTSTIPIAILTTPKAVGPKIYATKMKRLIITYN